MVRFLPGVSALLGLLLFGGAVCADDSPPLFPRPDRSPSASPAEAAKPNVCDICAACDGDHESLFSLGLMLGMQTGVRAQAALVRQKEWEVVGEAYYGLLLTKLGASEGGGLGGRAVWRRTSGDGANSLLFGPGFDLLYEFKNNGALMAAPTVDVSWLHGFGDRGGWETGLNVGVGVGLAGNRNGGQSAAGVFTPLISVTTGLRY